MPESSSRLLFAVFVTIVVALGALVLRAQSGADLVLANGRIYTVDAAMSSAFVPTNVSVGSGTLEPIVRV